MKTEVNTFGNDVETRYRIKSLDDALAVIQKLERDGMTGFYRKDVFDGKLDEMLALAREQRSSVAYLMVDGDGFKKINDTYGHAIGDKVITHVANVLGASVRTNYSNPNFEQRRGSLDGATDLVGRVATIEDTVEIGRVGSGDEFGVAVYGVDAAHAYDVAERMHRALRAKPYETADGKRIQLTMSIGIATTETATTREQLYKGADEALYAAKANGRNCTTIHRRTVQEAVPASAHYQPAEVAA